MNNEVICFGKESVNDLDFDNYVGRSPKSQSELLLFANEVLQQALMQINMDKAMKRAAKKFKKVKKDD